MSDDVRTLALLAAVACVAAATATVAIARVPATRSTDPRLVGLARAATALSAAVWVLLVFGSSVRVNGAGLACPDWPACFGQVVPAIDWPVFLEFGHRVYAGVVSLLFAGLAVAALRRPDLRTRTAALFVAGFVALAVQIVLGGLTVLHLLAEWTVASHLIGGNTFSAIVALLALELRDAAWRPHREPVSRLVRPVGALFAALLVAQLALGGLVSSSHAGLACGTWPGCNGQVLASLGSASLRAPWACMFPTFEGLIGLQVMHRLTAYGLVAVGLGALAITRGRGADGRMATVAAAIVLLQATLGVANVLLHLPVEVTLLHSAGAGALVLAVTALNHAAWRAPLAAPVPAVVAQLVEAK